MLRLLRFIIGVALLPLCVALSQALLDTLRSIPDTAVLLSPETRALLAGYFLWLGMWFFLPQPVRAYVAAHELTHALWGLLFGARVRDVRISSGGGSVRLTKTNMLITLAPYFFPLYTAVVILLRLLVGLAVEPVPLPFLWLFLVGLTWSFHVTFTVQSLLIHQPDIHEYGQLFSYAVIYLFNLAGIGLWIVCTTPVTFGVFSSAVLLHTAQDYLSVYETVTHRAKTLYDVLLPALKRLLIRPGV